MIELVLMLQAMTTAPVPCEPGVYVERDGGELAPLAEHLTDHRKVSGMLGYVLLHGFGNMTVKAVMAGKGAGVKTKGPRPVFVFCAPDEPATAEGGMDYVGASAPGLLPHQFRLVRFDVQGDQREVPLSAANVTGAKGAAVRQSTIRVLVDEVLPGRFRVAPQEDLVPGEYGFLKTVGNTTAFNGKKAAPERVFDFAVE